MSIDARRGRGSFSARFGLWNAINSVASSASAPDPAPVSAQAQAQAPPAPVKARSGPTLPRLYHKKSKTGCQRCRSRRVKCDETHPVCSSCARHGVSCVYDRVQPRPEGQSGGRREPERSSVDLPAGGRAAVLGSAGEPAESRERRLLELKLLLNYTSKTAFTLSSDPSSPGHLPWTVNVVAHLCMQNEGLLYSILCISALHLTKGAASSAFLHPPPPSPAPSAGVSPPPSDALADKDVETDAMMDAYVRYFGMALRSHQADVKALNASNTDAACITSTMIRMLALARLQERSLESLDGGYEPPTEWLRTTRGAGKVFAECWRWISTHYDGDRSTVREGNGAIAARLVSRAPYLTDPSSLYTPENRRGLEHLLAYPMAGNSGLGSQYSNDGGGLEEPWDEAIERTYASTLSCIGTIRATGEAVGDNVTPITSAVQGDFLRMLIVFPMMVPLEFFDLVQARRPRALVVLAHFFALLARCSGHWWVGHSGSREVRAIAAAVRGPWRDLMDWPLSVVD